MIGSRPALALSTRRSISSGVTRSPHQVRTHRHDSQSVAVSAEGDPLGHGLAAGVVTPGPSWVRGFGTDTEEGRAGVRDGGGGNVHQPAHPGVTAGVDHRRGALHVGSLIVGPAAHDVDFCREVQDRVVPSDGSCDGGAVRDVGEHLSQSES